MLAATLARLDGARLVLGAVVFGAVLPTLVALILVAPLKGQPTVTGVVPLAVLAAVLVNGAWGLGTGLGIGLFRPPARAIGDLFFPFPAIVDSAMPGSTMR